jgi:hypothetical protein
MWFGQQVKELIIPTNLTSIVKYRDRLKNRYFR